MNDVLYWTCGIIGASVDAVLLTYHAYKAFKINKYYYFSVVAMSVLFMILIRFLPIEKYHTFFNVAFVYFVLAVFVGIPLKKRFWLFLYMVAPFVLSVFIDLLAYGTVYKIDPYKGPYYGWFMAVLFKLFSIRTMGEFAAFEIKGNLMQITKKIIYLIGVFSVLCISVYYSILRLGG